MVLKEMIMSLGRTMNDPLEEIWKICPGKANGHTPRPTGPCG